MKTAKKPLLSICIATFNRGNFIKETIDSILSQNNELVEIIIVDGASIDQTQEILSNYATKHDNLYYYREQLNSGVDGDYDKAVKYAKGEYCWLMTDDDILKDDSIAYLIGILKLNKDLVVVNSEVWNANLTKDLKTKMINIPIDKNYSKDDEREMFIDIATCISFIGSVIIKKQIWIERNRETYYGTLFVHVGVIFQQPFANGVYLVSKTILKIRYGNSMWTPKSFEIWYYKWPKLIWSFDRFDNIAKNKIVSKEPWRRIFSLLKSRAMGDYTFNEYKVHISKNSLSPLKFISYLVSITNPKILNLILVMSYMIFKPSAKYTLFDLLRSKHCISITKRLAKIFNFDLLGK
jgi:abequosyltransferase